MQQSLDTRNEIKIEICIISSDLPLLLYNKHI